jgi:2-desacetyl-2-hydroxyethyl bacteriochlorophyllide A dehydrogenase
VRAKALYFIGPRQLEIREIPLRPLGERQLLIQTEISGISAGTEMLLYRGELPAGSEPQVDNLSHALAYPTGYGYACVGRVVEVGRSANAEWKDRLVFAFQPHESHFVADQDAVIAVPEGLAAEDAIFLPNMETAVNLVQDSSPLLGERALVLGQGVVGLLTTALMSGFPMECLVTADRYEARRDASLAAGATRSLDPAASGFEELALVITGADQPGYDVTLELSGNPAAMNSAVALTAFAGRILVGSWYGSKTAPIRLGGRFHRSRITIRASQVSTIAPKLTGRWNKARRFQTAWSALDRIRPSRWITHRFNMGAAAEAYRLLDETPQLALQVVLDYP